MPTPPSPLAQPTQSAPPEQHSQVFHFPPVTQQQRPRLTIESDNWARLVGRVHELLPTHSPTMFQYGGLLAQVIRAPKNRVSKRGSVPKDMLELETVQAEALRLEMARIARWQHWKRGNLVPTNPPRQVATGVLADRKNWRVPVLTGVTEIPILRPDGTVCATPGYDAATGMYFDPGTTVFPPVPDAPDANHVLAALAALREPLRDFPFRTPVDESAALALILTALVRRSLAAAPAFGVSAVAAGTGKGLLVDVAAVLMTGRRAPITPFTVDEAEQRKRITAALLAGHPILNIDNVDAPVDSAALAALLTSETWSDRILGLSKTADVPSNALVVLTGNNLVIQGDLTRRVIPIELDAGCERPELRRFNRDLLDWLAAERPALVTAALTLLSAWRRAALPAALVLGSYESWSRDVAAPLAALGLPNPITALDRLSQDDPKRALLRRVLIAWYATLGANEWTLRQAKAWCVKAQVAPAGTPEQAVAIPAADLLEAFDEIGADARSEQARQVKVGNWLSQHAGRVANVTGSTGQPITLRLEQGAKRDQAVLWRVTRI